MILLSQMLRQKSFWVSIGLYAKNILTRHIVGENETLPYLSVKMPKLPTMTSKKHFKLAMLKVGQNK